jgi:hypothetical protein
VVLAARLRQQRVPKEVEVLVVTPLLLEVFFALLVEVVVLEEKLLLLHLFAEAEAEA